MKTAATAFAVASAFTAVYAQGTAGNLVIQSPASLVECQPALLSFSGGSAPYYISVLPGGQSTAAALEQFPQQSGNTYTWTVDLASGQDVTFSIRDSTGLVNYSAQLPIQSGSDTSCLNGGGSSSSGGSSSASSGGSSSAASSSRSSSASRTPLSSSSTGSSSSSATTSASTTDGRNANAAATTSTPSTAATASPTGAADKYFVNIAAVAGVAGLVALLA